MAFVDCLAVCPYVCRHLATHERGDVRAKRSLWLRVETSRHVGQISSVIQSLQPVRQRHIRFHQPSHTYRRGTTTSLPVNFRTRIWNHERWTIYLLFCFRVSVVPVRVVVSADIRPICVSVKPRRQSSSRSPAVWYSSRLCQTKEQDHLTQRRQSYLEWPVHVPGLTLL